VQNIIIWMKSWDIYIFTTHRVMVELRVYEPVRHRSVCVNNRVSVFDIMPGLSFSNFSNTLKLFSLLLCVVKCDTKNPKGIKALYLLIHYTKCITVSLIPVLNTWVIKCLKCVYNEISLTFSFYQYLLLIFFNQNDI